jgi:hypothetical protein
MSVFEIGRDTNCLSRPTFTHRLMSLAGISLGGLLASKNRLRFSRQVQCTIPSLGPASSGGQGGHKGCQGLLPLLLEDLIRC